MTDETKKKINLLGERFAELFENEEYQEAVPIAQEIFDLTRKKNGPEHITYLETIRDFGIVCRMAGDLDRAEQLFQHAYEICNKTFRDNEAAAGIPYNLALISDGKGDYDKAIFFMKKPSKPAAGC